MKKLFLIFIFAAIIVTAILMFHDLVLCPSRAEQPPGTTVGYLVCVPHDYVKIRSKPYTHSEVFGRFEPGEIVYLDGKRRGEFLHCVGLRLEDTEGWIHRGYIVDAEPELIDRPGLIVSRGRVAARKNINGKRTKWLKNGTELNVYYWAGEWTLTNKGYVKSDFIEIDYSDGDEN